MGDRVPTPWEERLSSLRPRRTGWGVWREMGDAEAPSGTLKGLYCCHVGWVSPHQPRGGGAEREAGASRGRKGVADIEAFSGTAALTPDPDHRGEGGGKGENTPWGRRGDPWSREREGTAGDSGVQGQGTGRSAAQRPGAARPGRDPDWGGDEPPEPEPEDHPDPGRPADRTQARSPAFPGGRADPVLPSSQPTAARAWHLSAPPPDKWHMTRSSRVAHARTPRPPPSPTHSSAGVPPSPPPALTSRRRGSRSGWHGAQRLTSREAGDASGAIRGRFGAAPAPRRVPGRRAADSRPAGGSRSGASGRRPPGQRELGRERGAGSRRARARGRAGARRPEQGQGVTGTTVKGATPPGLWAHRAGTGSQGPVAEGIREGQ